MPVDEPEPVVAPITIEVLSSGLHLVADGAPSLTATPDAEHPQNCPKCNAAGVVDLVDLVGHTTHLTCPICGTMWQVRQTDDAPITQ